MFLAESKNHGLVPIFVDSAPKQPRGWSEVFDLEPCGECSLKFDEEFSGFSREDGVVDVYNQNVDESLDKENEDPRVDKGLGEAVGYKS